jgi:hypothetical protein
MPESNHLRKQMIELLQARLDLLKAQLDIISLSMYLHEGRTSQSPRRIEGVDDAGIDCS